MSDCAMTIEAAKQWGIRMPRRWTSFFGGCAQHNAASAVEYADYRHQRSMITSLLKPLRYSNDN